MTLTSGLDELRRELAELCALRDIEDLLSRYGFYSDCGAVAAWLDLFCEDAFMDVPDYESGDPAATTRIAGRERLRTELVDNGTVRALRGRMQHHLCGPRTVEVSEGTAQVDSYAVVFRTAGNDDPSGFSLQFNRWTLRQVEGTWKIVGCVRRPVDQSLPFLRDIADTAGSRGSATRTRSRVSGVNHVAISVSDLARSIAFYTERLGLTVVATQPAIESIGGMATVTGYDDEVLRGSWALLAAGPDRVELVSYRSPAGQVPTGVRRPADIGLAHVALQVDDVDAVRAELTSAGVVTVSEPVDLGRHRSFYAYGPDGELIELLEERSPVPPGSPSR
ncbi:VOC family protein [Amycolatopsis alkalitolerans]|nr:VOC family protein [Amycolatopsis alkalitolerans]